MWPQRQKAWGWVCVSETPRPYLASGLRGTLARCSLQVPQTPFVVFLLPLSEDLLLFILILPPTHMCVSLINYASLSFILSLAGCVCVCVSTSHTHDPQTMGLCPMNTLYEIFCHTYFTGAPLFFLSPSAHPPSPPSVGKSKILVLTAVVKALDC